MERPAAVDRLAAMVLENESRAAEVARLLHDHAGQTLTAIGFQLQTLDGNREAAAEIAGLLEQAIENIRLACNRLQSNVVERAGICIAVELLAERLRRETGLRVGLRMDAERRLPGPVGHAVYRIVELALDNVSRHSGADSAEVRLEITGAGLDATIQDFGCGFAANKAYNNSPGTGLILMQSYASSANLHLRVASTRRRGTIVRVKTNDGDFVPQDNSSG